MSHDPTTGAAAVMARNPMTDSMATPTTRRHR